MKQAICGKCGIEFDAKVPDDAEDITCFDCAEREYNQEQEQKRNEQQERNKAEADIHRR